MKRGASVLTLLGLALAVCGVRSEPAQSGIEAAFSQFWNASTPEDAAAVVTRVAKSGVSFDEALRRLKTGRAYATDVPTGVVHLSRRAPDGVEFHYSLDVPASYDPRRQYQVRFQLHGGVGAGEDNRRRGTGSIGRFGGDEQIYVLPTSWLDAPWWSEAQIGNLRAILDRVKRTYNVDENRVVVSGESDGGTAAFYLAMRDTTPYASFLPLNGYLLLLAGRNLSLGDLFPNNLLNKPFFVVNGGRDILYPTAIVDPVIRDLQNAGVSVLYKPQPEAGHNTAWWPEIAPAFEAFVREHPRKPLPETLTWQRGDPDPFGRAHWLIVEKLREEPDDSRLPDVNLIPTPPSLQFGVLSAGTRITRVVPESAAAAIGVRVGDVVTTLNGQRVSPNDDLSQALERCCRAGARIELLVSRGGETVPLEGIYSDAGIYGPRVPMFARRRPSGRVDVVKAGNTVRATTSGVAAYTLLLAPGAFDFARPVTVITNGKVSFQGRVVKSLATLLKWAAADNDRTMLFGAELTLSVD